MESALFPAEYISAAAAILLITLGAPPDILKIAGAASGVNTSLEHPAIFILLLK